MSQENVDLVRRLIAEFGPSRAGIEEAARVGLVAPDAEFDFSALYPDGPIKRGLEGWRSFTDSLPWGGSAFAPELASCERLIQSITRRAGVRRRSVLHSGSHSRAQISARVRATQSN